MRLRPTDTKLFFSRGDAQDRRLGDFTQGLVLAADLSDLSPRIAVYPRGSCFIVGYADDEGIRMNGGRPGAALAPPAVRRSLYKMTPSLLSSHEPVIVDLGDMVGASVSDSGTGSAVAHSGHTSIEQRHATATLIAREVLRAQSRWFAIGGGHDYGFSDADAFLGTINESKSARKPIVINFDAHLDVRSSVNGPNSGTPFFRMLEKYPGTEFIEVGIQAHCNSKSHLEWAKSHGALILTIEQLLASSESLTTQLMRLTGDRLVKRRPTFLSVDIDGFSSAYAPGCSQSWATGFEPRDFFNAFDFLMHRCDVQALGIYEVSPPLDHDDRTSKLAAQIIHRAIFSNTSSLTAEREELHGN
jgi:formiminoglutamase